MSFIHFQKLPLQIKVRVIIFLLFFRQTLSMAVQTVWAFVLGLWSDGGVFLFFLFRRCFDLLVYLFSVAYMQIKDF